MKPIDRLRREIKEFPRNYILLLAKPEDYAILYFSILRLFLNELGYRGICITVNKPGKILFSELEKRGIVSKNLWIIDCISEIVGLQKAERSEQISTPANLTNLSLAVSKVLAKMEGKEMEEKEGIFLLLDSLSSLLIYNSAGDVLKFSNFLTNKIKALGIGGIFITVEEEIDPKIIGQLVQFCDKLIKI